MLSFFMLDRSRTIFKFFLIILYFAFYSLSSIRRYCIVGFLFLPHNCKTITRSFKNSWHDRWYSDMYIENDRTISGQWNSNLTQRDSVERRQTMGIVGLKGTMGKKNLHCDSLTASTNHDSMYLSIIRLRAQYNYFKSME